MTSKRWATPWWLSIFTLSFTLCQTINVFYDFDKAFAKKLFSFEHLQNLTWWLEGLCQKKLFSFEDQNQRMTMDDCFRVVGPSNPEASDGQESQKSLLGIGQLAARNDVCLERVKKCYCGKVEHKYHAPLYVQIFFLYIVVPFVYQAVLCCVFAGYW